jgi:hypothetical protein
MSFEGGKKLLGARNEKAKECQIQLRKNPPVSP